MGVEATFKRVEGRMGVGEVETRCGVHLGRLGGEGAQSSKGDGCFVRLSFVLFALR